MQTSGLRSAVPPNQAATKSDLVSAMVEAWQDGNGAVSKMNSDFTMALSFSVGSLLLAKKGVRQQVRQMRWFSFIGLGLRKAQIG